MNPTLNPKTGPTLVRDVTPPSAINAEIVSDIPVKNPLGSVSQIESKPIGNPVAQIFKPSGTSTDALEDKVMDHILKDVNDSVKKADSSVETQFEHLSGVRKKVAVKKAKARQTPNGSPPIVATIMACLVAAALTAAAFYIYSKGY